ncbi:hypothetical protein LEN26_021348 [Aphanomyces euteiches]|nr:hypothetical protein LEN26_021348 [Aphanomyces euteiches]KAH9103243.1 hypothetical protein AeMF1_020381 [Aphanomyces euteiches]
MKYAQSVSTTTRRNHTFMQLWSAKPSQDATVHRADIAPWEDDNVHVRVRGSSDDRRSLEAIDVQSKFVVFANVETVVAAYWNLFSTSSPMHTSTVIEAVDDDLMYIA